MKQSLSNFEVSINLNVLIILIRCVLQRIKPGSSAGCNVLPWESSLEAEQRELSDESLRNSTISCILRHFRYRMGTLVCQRQ